MTAYLGALALLTGLQGLSDGFIDAAPRCDSATVHCVGIELFVTIEDGAPVQDAAWWAGELRHANELFGSIGVAFELQAVRFVGTQWSHVHSRLDRDRLGRRDRQSGLVHVFMVRQLDDVDIEGNLLYGVHWRDRADTSNRWIILSARDSSSTVLAHEMGHYFGLPHSRYEISIMNKMPRDRPTWPERIFAPPEVEKMRGHRDRMLESGFLKER